MLVEIMKLRPEIEAFCDRFRVSRLDLIGSTARGLHVPGTSDVDFLVSFESVGWDGYSDRYFGLLHGLEDLLGTRVDLVDAQSELPPLFVEQANHDRQLIYASKVPQTA